MSSANANMSVYRRLTGNRVGYTSPMYGVEVEVENVSLGEHARQQNDLSFQSEVLMRIARHWRATSDGSLRNRGMEWISMPDSVEGTLERLRLLYTGMEQGAFAPSVRTGIHVHANVQHLMGPEIVALMRRYAVLEPLLFLYVGEAREQNIYCVPLYRAANERALWQSIATALPGIDTARPEVARLFDNCCKYSALNLQPMRRQGSAEYRHAPTFSSRKEAEGWLKLVDYVHSSTAFPEGTWTETTLRDIWERGAMPCSADTFKQYMGQVTDRGLLSFANSLLPFTYKVAEWGSPAGLAFPVTKGVEPRARYRVPIDSREPEPEDFEDSPDDGPQIRFDDLVAQVRAQSAALADPSRDPQVAEGIRASRLFTQTINARQQEMMAAALAPRRRVV
jgi:hypothetical protein